MKRIKDLFKVLFSWDKDIDGNTRLLKMIIFNGRKSDVTQQDILRGMKAKRKENHEINNDHADDGLV